MATPVPAKAGGCWENRLEGTPASDYLRKRPAAVPSSRPLAASPFRLVIPESYPAVAPSSLRPAAYHTRPDPTVEIAHWRTTRFPTSSPIRLPAARVISTVFAWLLLPYIFTDSSPHPEFHYDLG